MKYSIKLSGGEMSVAYAVINPCDIPQNSDASGIIQSAVDACEKDGGGVVWLEGGKYLLEKPVTVKTSVVLHGSWNKELDFDGSETVLLCKYGRNAPKGVGQINLEACSGLKNLLIYYPEQDIADPVPYSPAVFQNGVDNVTVENVVMINPWRGIQCGPNDNELHFIKNVYISPLEIGLYMDMTTDIGRLQGLHISPDYCKKYLPDTDIDALRKYMLGHTVGVFMARSDWEYGYDVSTEYCMEGFRITAVKDSGPNAQLSGIKIRNCATGIRFVNVNPYGIALSDSEIKADIDGLEAAVSTDESFETLVQLNGVDIGGKGYRHLVSHKGKGQISFADCTFTGWNEEHAAVKASDGGISFVQCDFAGGDKYFCFDKKVGGAQILGCTFKDTNGEKKTPEIRVDGKLTDIENVGFAVYSEESANLPKASRGGHKPYPYATEPKSQKLFLASDFGANRDGKTDDTAAIQSALDAAAKDGGGIVYLPGGWYFCQGHLNVPSGVEIRGVAETPFHTIGGGSVLLTVCGRGDENAEPFMTLEENSGVRGVVFYNPEQDASEPVKFPFAIQSRGRSCHVINANFVNMWQALDMGSYPSEGHYVSYITGAPFKCGVFLGSNDGEGWVENVQFNPHYWYRSSLPDHPDDETWTNFWFNEMKYLEALKFGYNKNEHLLGTFVFAARHGLGFVLQNGKGTTGKFIGHGTDSGLIALYLEGAEHIEMINTQLVNIQADGQRSYIASEPDAKGEFLIYNTLMWGDPHYAAIFNGGKVFVEQMNIVDPGKTAITVNGGDIMLACVYFQRVPVKCVANGGKTEFYAPATKRSGENDSSERAFEGITGKGNLIKRFCMIK